MALVAMKDGRIIVGFAPHRSDILEAFEQAVEQTEAVILEEHPNDGFRAMLEGERSIEDYLPETGTAYPMFTRNACRMFRRFHRAGKVLFQVDPYMAVLERLQFRLEAGDSPKDFHESSAESQVYRVEHDATGALLAFYRLSVRSPFPRLVDGVIRFARYDARRLDLRDRMRADSIASLASRFTSIFVEAGDVHLGLSVHLRRLLPKNVRLESRLLLSSIAKSRFDRRLRLNPGDLLTHRLRQQPDAVNHRHRLWAARSLIYNKIQTKEEIDAENGRMLHLADEIAVTEAVSSLSFGECDRLFERIRHLKTMAARQTVFHYIGVASDTGALLTARRN